MFNQVLLIGHAGSQPKLYPGERPRATLQIATHRAWKGDAGMRCEDTQWHPLVFWDRQAQLAEQLLDKGQLLVISGRLKHSSWQDRKDPTQTHYRTEVVVERFHIASPRIPSPDASESRA